MKVAYQSIYWAVMFALCACAVDETETLKQARNIQISIESDIAHIDSLVATYTYALNNEINTLSTDTTIQIDTTKRSNYNRLKLLLDSANILFDALSNWKSTMKQLPSAQEIGNGATNPFGEGADDKATLNGMTQQNSECQLLLMQLLAMCTDTVTQSP